MGGLTVATIMAGILLVILGPARLGATIRFIPFPVTLGFTSGIALVILTGQVGMDWPRSSSCGACPRSPTSAS
ncbi:MAG: hypothetical protein L0271_24500 [Gemmatimonadetes bacterium]|nr:hypothetical protein [Gemmatimonadota bacterium]